MRPDFSDSGREREMTLSVSYTREKCRLSKRFGTRWKLFVCCLSFLKYISYKYPLFGRWNQIIYMRFYLGVNVKDLLGRTWMKYAQTSQVSCFVNSHISSLSHSFSSTLLQFSSVLAWPLYCLLSPGNPHSQEERFCPEMWQASLEKALRIRRQHCSPLPSPS